MNIAVTNRKGGVGKSTHALHLASGLATVGYRVLLVDTDSQGHMALSFGLPQEDGLFNVLVNPKEYPIEKSVREVSSESYSVSDQPSKGALFLLPSHNNTYRIPTELGEFSTFKFLHLLDTIKEKYQLHFVVIDTSPTLNTFDGQIYLAADAFLYVTEAEKLSRHGVEEAISQMLSIVDDRRQYLNRDTTILGIIPNKVRNTDAHQINLEMLLETYGKLIWDPVYLRTTWSEASLMDQPLFTYAPTSKATDEAWRVVAQAVEAIRLWQSKETK